MSRRGSPTAVAQEPPHPDRLPFGPTNVDPVPAAAQCALGLIGATWRQSGLLPQPQVVGDRGWALDQAVVVGDRGAAGHGSILGPPCRRGHRLRRRTRADPLRPDHHLRRHRPALGNRGPGLGRIAKDLRSWPQGGPRDHHHAGCAFLASVRAGRQGRRSDLRLRHGRDRPYVGHPDRGDDPGSDAAGTEELRGDPPGRRSNTGRCRRGRRPAARPRRLRRLQRGVGALVSHRSSRPATPRNSAR